VAGPVIALSAEAVTGIALIFHELATNAAKYGALHENGGAISVTWRVNGDFLELSWRETGCHQNMEAPKHPGFGSVLLRRSIENQFGGAIAHCWNDDGVSISMTALLSRLSEH
jgi:two-component sensor histidine kinase